MRRANTAVIVIVVLVIAVAIALLVFKSSESLTAHVPDYIQMRDEAFSAQATDAAPQAPAVVVDYERKRIDDLHKQLSSALRAEAHADVQSVVIIIRSSTGLPGASMGIAIASAQEGSYSIAALIYDSEGSLLRAHSINKKTAMTGAGAEGEAAIEADAEMIDWIKAQFDG